MTAVQSPSLRRVMRARTCSGCGMCAGIAEGAIAMKINASGYLRPDQSRALEAKTETAIARACPGVAVAPWPDDGRAHPEWGPVARCSVGHATNPELRFQASSGGALSALLIELVERGLVDAVVHVTADPDDPPANVVGLSRTPEEILAAAGSRYAPSAPLSALSALLQAGERYAFVGKPCDVSALRRLSTADPRIDRHFPYMLSFFCGGIPSMQGIDRMLDAMAAPRDRLSAFRYRGNGWPGSAVATMESGEQRTMSYARSWGDFLSGSLQFRCKICPDSVGGAADIACADAWYGDERGYPSFDEQDGRSLIIARTATGAALLDLATDSGRIVIDALDPDEIVKMQPGQARRKRLVAARTLAMRLLGLRPPQMRGLKVGEASRRIGMAMKLRNLLGTGRRIVIGAMDDV